MEGYFVLVHAHLSDIFRFDEWMQGYGSLGEEAHSVDVLLFAIQSELEVLDDFELFLLVDENASHTA